MNCIAGSLSFCGFISVPPSHFLYTFSTLSTTLLPLPFLLPHSISLFLLMSLPPWLIDSQHVPVLVFQSAVITWYAHLDWASDSCLLKSGLWIITASPPVHTVEHWFLFSSQLLIFTKLQQLLVVKHQVWFTVGHCNQKFFWGDRQMHTIAM